MLDKKTKPLTMNDLPNISEADIVEIDPISKVPKKLFINDKTRVFSLSIDSSPNKVHAIEFGRTEDFYYAWEVGTNLIGGRFSDSYNNVYISYDLKSLRKLFIGIAKF